MTSNELLDALEQLLDDKNVSQETISRLILALGRFKLARCHWLVEGLL